MQIADNKGAEPLDFVGWLEEVRHHDRHHACRGCRSNSVVGIFKRQTSLRLHAERWVSIRSGAKKPNISTVNAFKNALLNAESITYATQGASAAPFEVLVAKLGITSALKPKFNLRPTASEVGQAVSTGAVELGIAPVSEILPVRGVDLVGPFPKEIQSYVELTAAISASPKEKDAAGKLIAFLIAPGNLPVYKLKGMER